LALWSSGLMAIALALFSVAVVSLQARWSHAQFDDELAAINTTVFRAMQEELHESGNFRKAVHETQESVDLPGRTTVILDSDGEPVLGRWYGFPRELVSLKDLIGQDRQFATVRAGGGTWRLFITRQSAPAATYFILVASSLDALVRQQQQLSRT